MNSDRAVVFSSELGWMCAAWRTGLLRELTFGHASPDEAVRAMRHAAVSPTEPSGALRRFARRLQRFAREPGDDFSDVELDLAEHTPFQRQIVDQCRKIAIGETWTYAELARSAGRPGAARATGQVMATNRFSLIVPCHRVVGSGGSLGGYSAPEGLRMKRRLLALEQSVLASLAVAWVAGAER